MENLFVKEFKGKKIYTFIWNDKTCWIAIHIAELFGYERSSKAVNQCIKSEKFEGGHEYDVLTGDNLKHIPKLVIFYEDGLYGFRKWLRREVLPELRKTGTYSIYEKEEVEEEDIKEEEGYPNTKDNLIPLDNQDRVLQIIKLINNIVEINKENKISDLKEILYLK